MQFRLHWEATARVTRVPDGDGLEVYRNGTTTRIRLRHIDAPEDGQPYATQARHYLESLCFQQIVNLTVYKWDNYSRAIADVTLPNGTNLSAAMIGAGLAWWYRRFSRTAYYGELERFARMKSKGLWKDPNPTPPWEFRKAKRLRSRKRC